MITAPVNCLPDAGGTVGVDFYQTYSLVLIPTNLEPLRKKTEQS
jgi:hypothetical protein